jgi:ATP-dependent RNA helicase DDX24/MAK5
LEQDDDLAKQIKSLKFLVLDEADRMVEAGHFAELEHILRLTLRRSRFVFLCLSPLKASYLTLPLNSEDEIEPEFNDTSDVEEDLVEGKDDMQTFVFSATLSKDLQRNVKKRTRPKGAWNNKNEISSTLGLLFDF